MINNDRRGFIKTMGALAIGSMFPSFSSAATNTANANLGLIPGKLDREGFYEISNLDGFGKGKQAFLSNAYSKVVNRLWYPITQFKGDCVGIGVTTALDYLTVTQTLQRKTSWQGNHSIIATYVGGRELAGKYPIGDGAYISWMIDYLEQYGALLKRAYGIDDLSQYNSNVYYTYKNGLTDNLKVAAKQHPLLHSERVRSYSETRDAIAGGYPVIIGSNMGVLGATKDKDGFFYPRGFTPHCMCCIGVDDKDRKSILIQNSHGAGWAPGPKRYGFEPEGSAWIDADTFNKHISYSKDSCTISLFKGYPVKKRYVLW